MSKTRRGRCHCGAVVFEVELEAGLGEMRRCNCSLCHKRGVVMASVLLDKLTVIEGQESLSLYQWNTGIARHYFCKVCGVYTHHQRRSRPDEFAFNVACLDGPDPTEGVELAWVDGASSSLVTG